MRGVSDGILSYYNKPGQNSALMTLTNKLSVNLGEIIRARQMNIIGKFIIAIAVFLVGVADCHAETLVVGPNHLFDRVDIKFSHADTGCSFQYSPFDFCDARHIAAIKYAISNKSANFNKRYILLSIEEWPPSPDFKSLVAIDTLTGIVYPVPIDDYSGHMNNRGNLTSKPKLSFSLQSNRLCIDGAILVYRATTNGHFCFDFDGEKFTGYQTGYMR